MSTADKNSVGKRGGAKRSKREKKKARDEKKVAQEKKRAPRSDGCYYCERNTVGGIWGDRPSTRIRNKKAIFNCGLLKEAGREGELDEKWGEKEESLSAIKRSKSLQKGKGRQCREKKNVKLSLGVLKGEEKKRGRGEWNTRLVQNSSFP